MRLLTAAVAVVSLAVVRAAPTPAEPQHPMFRLAGGKCGTACDLPIGDVLHVDELRDELCSDNGRQQLFECAACVDEKYPVNVLLEDSAISQYFRVMAVCDSIVSES